MTAEDVPAEDVWPFIDDNQCQFTILCMPKFSCMK
jgi:hypothetical protein